MEGFKAQEMGIRIQKKILSRMASKNVAKVFIDDTSASILDNLYRLAKYYSGDKKLAEKLIKNIIKIVIKMALVYRHEQISTEEVRHAERFKVKFHAAAMAIISFYEVDFSYDRTYLLKHLRECQASLIQLVQRHLTDKSIGRIHMVFDFFTNVNFLDLIFRKDYEHRDIVGKIVNDMNKALDTGDL